MELTHEDWFALCTIILFFLWGIAIFLFGRISVKHIEQKMAKDGKRPPEWDKGIGARVAAYSLLIIFPRLTNKNSHSFMDDEAVIRHACKKDWYLAMFLQVSSATFMIAISIAYYLYAP